MRTIPVSGTKDQSGPIPVDP